MLKREAHDRQDRVFAEFEAAAFALAFVTERWNADPSVMLAARRAEVTNPELVRSAATLEVTFSLRLFSDFEAVLRDYWVAGLNRKTQPDMRVLMDSIARRRKMGPTDLQSAHDVREYRNEVVHAGLLAPRLDLADCQRGLGCYLRWLPQQW